MLLRSRIPLRAILVLPPPVVGLVGAAALCVGVAFLLRTVDLVRHPHGVARERRGLAHYWEWTAEARRAYAREQWAWTAGLLLGGVVLLVIGVARS